MKTSPIFEGLLEQQLEKLFVRHDADGNGVITVEDIAPYYDASKHPDVVSGRMGKSTALMKFLDGFEGSVVTVQEWLSYYEDLSASIDSDDYFGQMMAT